VIVLRGTEWSSDSAKGHRVVTFDTDRAIFVTAPISVFDHHINIISQNKHFSCNSKSSHLYFSVYETKLLTYKLKFMKSFSELRTVSKLLNQAPFSCVMSFSWRFYSVQIKPVFFKTLLFKYRIVGV
jgi:hypothetical protein